MRHILLLLLLLLLTYSSSQQLDRLVPLIVKRKYSNFLVSDGYISRKVFLAFTFILNSGKKKRKETRAQYSQSEN